MNRKPELANGDGGDGNDENDNEYNNAGNHCNDDHCIDCKNNKHKSKPTRRKYCNFVTNKETKTLKN